MVVVALLFAAQAALAPVVSPHPGHLAPLAHFALRPGEQLEVARALPRAGGQVLRMRQIVLGVPVWQGEAIARLDALGRVERVWDHRKEVGPFDPRPWVTAAEAARVAALASEVPLAADAAARARTRLWVVPGEHPRLAWEVRLTAARKVDRPVAMVDAHTGALLASWNHRFHAEADPDLALVFPDPSDAASGSTATAILDHFPAVRDSGGHLVGERVIVHNCCPFEACDPQNPPKMTTQSYGSRTYVLATCDERPRATNLREAGNYVYAPAPEPDLDTPVPSPADGDEFAEVNAYYHLNLIQDFLFRLDPYFKLRQLSVPLHVTTNYLDTDYERCTVAGSTTTCPRLARFDNAYFMPGDGSSDYPYDELVFGQGALADYAYDADVMYHEFGHAVVQSATGDLYGMVLDSWGAWVAPGALNEGFADWLVSAKTNDPVIGDYAGRYGGEGQVDPETGEPIVAGIRVLDAGKKCPDHLENEVHADSQPLSGALWELGSALAGVLLPDEIHRAVLDAIKVLPTEASFDLTATIIMEELKDRKREAKIIAEQVFRNYGVLECERAWLLEEGKKIDWMPLNSRRMDPRFGQSAPGPWQLKLIAPEGATEATVTYAAQTWRGSASLRFVYSEGTPVRFYYPAGTQVEHGTIVTPVSQRVTIPLAGRCGTTPMYVGVLNDGGHATLANIRVEYAVDLDKVDACHPPPPPPEDDPPGPLIQPSPPPAPNAEPAPAAEVETGCGCSFGGPGGPALAWPLLAAFGLWGRRRRVARCNGLLPAA